MAFYKVFYDDLKYIMNSWTMEKKCQLQNIYGYEIYIQNHIQSCAFEHHYSR